MLVRGLASIFASAAPLPCASEVPRGTGGLHQRVAHRHHARVEAPTGGWVSRQLLAIPYALRVRWMTRLGRITRQTGRMQLIVRAFLTAALYVLLSGCTPPAATNGSPAPTSDVSTTPAATASRSSAPKQYTRLELFRVPMQPEDLAVTATKIFVAQAGGGPRPPEVTGTVFEGPLDGSTAPREVPA